MGGQVFLDKKGHILIGLTEFVTIHGHKSRRVKARIDTGATRSSLDDSLAKELHLGPILTRRKVKSASGSGKRPIIECSITFAGKKIKAEFNLAPRSHMKYSLLIGRNILKKYNFLIDTKKE
jgi:hypothetical protein